MPKAWEVLLVRKQICRAWASGAPGLVRGLEVTALAAALSPTLLGVQAQDTSPLARNFV